MITIELAEAHSEMVGAPEEPPEPSPDLERILQRYVFRQIDTLEDYQQAGIELVELGTFSFIALGALLLRGWKELRPGTTWPNGSPIADVTDWERYCAPLWGCAASSLTKARRVAESYAIAMVPEGMSNTMVYEVQSGLTEDESLEDALGVVEDQRLNTWDVRVLKGLRKRELVAGWQMPLLKWEGREGRDLVIYDNGTREVAARFTETKLGRMAQYMLTRGIQVKGENSGRES